MPKPVMILVVSVLIVYYLFTSGLWFWASDCQNTSRLTTPFSWALSAERTGLTGVSTQDDINCLDWILNKSDQSMKVMADSNAVYLISGYMELLPDTWIILGREDRLLTLHAIRKVDKGYIFLTDWNTRHKKYIEPSDVGLRRSLPISVVDNTMIYVGFNGSDELSLYQCHVQEAYRSGNAVVYELVK